MKLSDFITAHTEEILKEWESFATTLLPAAAEMSQSELRDDAKQILRAIALDLETDQTRREQIKKSKGFMGVPADSAAIEHGELREASGFTLVQLVAEYRALRASVLRVWPHHADRITMATLDELTLLTNAAQYRDKSSSVTLTIRGEPAEIVVNARNRGPVIAPEFFEAIFNPLVQLTGTTAASNRPATSLGLGLHIARSIAVAHNGHISVNSTKNEGTVFTVKLPRV